MKNVTADAGPKHRSTYMDCKNRNAQEDDLPEGEKINPAPQVSYYAKLARNADIEALLNDLAERQEY